MLTRTAGPDCTPRHITTTADDLARMQADLGGEVTRRRDGALVYLLAGVEFIARCEHRRTRPATLDDQRPMCVTCLSIVAPGGAA